MAVLGETVAIQPGDIVCDSDGHRGKVMDKTGSKLEVWFGGRLQYWAHKNVYRLSRDQMSPLSVREK